MKINAFAFAWVALLWTACEPVSQKSETMNPPIDSATVKTDSLPMPRVWEVKTNTGKLITITETHPKGASLSDLKIHFQADTANVIRFVDVDPITATVIGDLDKNGFDEIYIISTSVGTGTYGNILGVSSNRDKSLSVMFVPEMNEDDKKPGKLFDGYEGHDEYAIENGVLIRRFPYKGDKNNMKSVPYQVMLGEGGLILAPKR